MAENLSDAFKLAKKSRNAQSKLLIWESGVSKSQFYRIISGKETPSLETKIRISKSLGIDPDQFDLLHSRSTLNQINDEALHNVLSEAKPAKLYVLMAIAIGLIGLMALLATNARRITPSTAVSVVQAEDSTLFIKDVTIPDGTSIPINTSYVKTWRVQNTGNVPWKGRYLMRVTPPSKLLCSSPAMVPIPETLPGEIIDISVPFVTPHLPGSCRTDWKTADARGNLFFPEKHGLFSFVVVTE